MFVLLIAWAAWAGDNAVRARHDLLIGKSLAEAARTETSPSDLEQALPVGQLQAASAQFHAARKLLDSPSLFLVRYFPVVGRQVESARALAGAGAEAADATASGLTAGHQLLVSRPTAGPARVAQLQQALAIAAQVGTRLKGLHYGPRVGLLSQLATAHNELQRDVTQVVDSLDKTVASGQSLLDLLRGQHRVLLMATNNAEMRAGSGIPLELGVLEINNGALVLDGIQSVNSYPVPAGAVKPPPDLAARWGWLHPADDWDEVLDSPRFDQTAPTAAQMWVAAGQPPVDAVMAIDPVFLADIVNVTGPITVANQTYAGTQIVPQVLNQQYVQISSRTARQDLLGQMATAAFARVNQGGWSLTSMIQALATVADGRHLMMWSNSPAVEAGWVRSGAGGALTSQSLLVNILNRGRNKLDWYLATASKLTVAARGSDTSVTVSVQMSDMTPPGLHGEIVGDQSGNAADLYPGQTLDYGDYLGVVAVSAPQAAHGLAIEGTAGPPVDGPDGPTQVVGAQYIVRNGASLTVIFTFTLPGVHGSMTVEPAGRYPAMTWTSGATSWFGDHAKVITW